MSKAFSINGRHIGENHPAFIIAEMSGNHNHDIKRAYKIIDAAKKSGVDAIKLQTYTPDTITLDSDKKWFQVTGTGQWDNQTLHDLYQSAYTPWEWHPKLKKYAEKKGLIFFSTPFDLTAVDFLEEMRVPLYKIASFEVSDFLLLRKVGQTKKPVILSRGLHSPTEIKSAIRTLKKYGTPQ